MNAPAVPSWPARVLMALVRGYRLLLSPWLGSSCRFEPTCSHYALQALQCHGAARGSLLSAARVLRCHPFCAGGHDPVPEQAPVQPANVEPPVEVAIKETRVPSS